MSPHDPELASRYLSSAAARAEGASARVFLAALALVVLWLGAIEKQNITTVAIFAAKRATIFHDSTSTSVLDSRNGWTSEHSTTRKQQANWMRRRQLYVQTRATQRAGVDSLVNALTEMPVDVLGQHLSVPPQLASVCWLLLLLAWTGYLLEQRRVCTALIERTRAA